MEQLGWVLVSGLTMGAIYTLVALGVVIVFSITKILNLAAGAFLVLGALLAATFYELGFPLLLSVVLALIIDCAIAAILWLCFLYYPYSTRVPEWTLLLITATLGIVLTGIIYIAWGTTPRALPYFTDFSPTVAGVTIPPQTLWIWGGAVLAVGGLFFVFHRTLLGKALRAVSMRPLAARQFGINPDHMALLSFVLAALLGGIGGVLIVPLTTASFTMVLGMSVKGALAAMLGGMDRFNGAITGGLVLGMAESFAGGYVSAEFMEAIALALLTIILLLRPEGIFGIREEEYCRK